MRLATFSKRKTVKMDNKKKKKKKVTYVDDGSTVYDMSALSGKRPAGAARGTAKDQFKTYMNAVKHMIIPMLITMAAISVVFGITYLLLTLAE